MSAPASDAAGARPPERAPLWFLPAGALIGFLGTLAGIGGGLFAVPLLHHVTRIPLKHATGTALLLVLVRRVGAGCRRRRRVLLAGQRRPVGQVVGLVGAGAGRVVGVLGHVDRLPEDSRSTRSSVTVTKGSASG